jgi:putative inorganic carbon (hco3(-)) transporter
MRVLPKAELIATEPSKELRASNKEERRFSRATNFKLALSGIVLLSGTLAILISMGLKFAVLLVALLIAVPTVFAIIIYPKFGIVALLIAAYFLMFVMAIGVDFPLGTLMDGFQVLLLWGLFFKQKYDPDWSVFKSPIAIIVLIWIVYSVLQLANPSAESRMAWFYTVRTVAVVSISFFIFSYHIRTKSFLKFILNLWMVLSFIGALNGFKQEYIGFFAFEEKNFNDPLVQALLFINGSWRKFSIFSDPVAFSYNMVISTLYAVSMMLIPRPFKQKLLYGFLAICFTWSMIFSGTRGAYVLLPAAGAFYIVLNMSRKVLAFAAVGAVFMLVLINIPTSNVTLYRFQSAFKPSDDASFNARKINQAKLKPYIQTHPFGGGLGAMGAWGTKFAPYSFLASIPPDSGYVRVGGELGWVGLILFCSMFFIALRQGILNYFAIRDPELKAICLAMTLIVFALNIGSYPQEALVQYPMCIYFYLFLAIINITLKLDQEEQLELTNNTSMSGDRKD